MRIGDWHFTRHALERIVEMELTCDQVEDLVRRPDMQRPSRGSSGRPALMLTADRHHFAVVVAEDAPVIVTVVFKTGQAYVRRGSRFEAGE